MSLRPSKLQCSYIHSPLLLIPFFSVNFNPNLQYCIWNYSCSSTSDHCHQSYHGSRVHPILTEWQNHEHNLEQPYALEASPCSPSDVGGGCWWLWRRITFLFSGVALYWRWCWWLACCCSFHIPTNLEHIIPILRLLLLLFCMSANEPELELDGGKRTFAYIE